MPTVGQSFSPFDQTNDPNKPGQGGPPANPVQDAIRLLSFRLPQVRGATTPPLQGGHSGLGSQLGGSIAEEWLKRFFQGNPSGPTPAVPGSAPGGGQVTPSPPANVDYRNPEPQKFTPPPPTPPAQSPFQRNGGWQDWPDPFHGGGSRGT